MNILAVDTTGEALSLAFRAGERTFSFHKVLAKPHDETLIPRVDALLARAGLELEDLDAIAVASGPGRFTGIRIGMAYAAVAASRLGIPALALSRFEGAASRSPGKLVCTVLPGWRDERFYQVFRRRGEFLAPAGEPVWADPESWPGKRSALERSGAAFVETETTAGDLLIPAARRLKGRRIPRFEPLYLKPASYESKRDQARAAR